MDGTEAERYGLVDELVDAPGPVHSVGGPAGAQAKAEAAEAQRATVVAHAVKRAHEFAISLPTISFAKCEKALGPERRPDPDRLESYLRDQHDCLNHPDHRQAAEAWLSRPSTQAEKAN